ncbi:hypothetical protein [Chitinophaga nivalis]|uniref:SnoaL-like domain-containing protein n=1 Tax=Chitinophaga nivalis TaxID=2991709 RepID=A0ABT3IN65_9BACT|nr:hypothetical protein [Chitinophaga nivalis]MCW3464897.1 hypothetical protein [Chitinophaga nivalis]MCW3485412.1 hypothetical protein [Chitinophaga nivalis]
MSIHHKQLVLDAFKQLIGEGNTALLDHYISDHYRQHNPTLKDGKAGLLAALSALQQQPRPATTTSPVRLVIADGDYVLLLLSLSLYGKTWAVADLYRIAHNQLAEHWDAMEVQPPVALISGDMAGDAAAGKTFIQQCYTAVITGAATWSAFFAPDYTGYYPDDTWMTVTQYQLHRIMGEGSLIGVQAMMVREGVEWACYDIFRLRGNSITAHWRVAQAIPAVMSHNNGML